MSSLTDLKVLLQSSHLQFTWNTADNRAHFQEVHSNSGESKEQIKIAAVKIPFQIPDWKSSLEQYYKDEQYKSKTKSKNSTIDMFFSTLTDSSSCSKHANTTNLYFKQTLHLNPCNLQQEKIGGETDNTHSSTSLYQYLETQEYSYKLIVDEFKNNSGNDNTSFQNHSLYSYLKSNLQKAVRLRNVDICLKTAIKLMETPTGMLELVRRLPVILCEDAIMHPYFISLIWLMLRLDDDFVPTVNHRMLILQILFDICEPDVPCEFRCGQNENNSNNDTTLIDKDSSPIALDLKSSISEALFGLVIRTAYGGMHGDLRLLNLCFQTWSVRSQHNKISDFSTPWNNNSMAHFPIPECWKRWQSRSNWFSVEFKNYLLTQNKLKCWILQSGNLLPTAIDFHVNRSMIDELLVLYPLHEDTKFKQEIRDLIWQKRSCVVLRRCICIDKVHNTMTNDQSIDNFDSKVQTWWKMITKIEQGKINSIIDTYCKRKWSKLIRPDAFQTYLCKNTTDDRMIYKKRLRCE